MLFKEILIEWFDPEETSSPLREEAWRRCALHENDRDPEAVFYRITNCVTYMVERIMEPIPTRNLRRAIIRCASKGEERSDAWSLRYRHLGDLRWEGDTAVAEAESGFRYELDMSL